jgi:hypothetical protein
MTVERRLVVGLKDIRAVTCECKKCGARLTLNTDSLRTALTTGRLSECPSCREFWLAASVTNGRKFTSETVMLLNAFALSAETQEAETIGVRILFEFDEPQTSSAPAL